MANKKISALTELTTPVAGDFLPIVDTSAGATRKLDFERLSGGTFNVKNYGATGDGTTDDAAAIQAAINAASSAGGGIVFFPQGVYKCNSLLDLAPDASADTPPRNPPITLQGVGQSYVNRSLETTPTIGSVLDLAYADTYGKLRSNISQAITLRDLTITASANFTTPLWYSTNAVPVFENVCFFGQSGTGQSSAQDAIVLGGPNQVEGGIGWTDGFQGYGGSIRGCFFRRIKSCIKGQAYFNAFVITGNTIWNDCGASDDTAAIDIDCGSSGQYDTGNEIHGNLIEQTNYAYGIKLGRTISNYCRNSFFDISQSKAKAAYKAELDSQYNAIGASYLSSKSGGGQLPIVDDDGMFTASGDTPTYISGTAFSVPTDRTSDYTAGRRVRITQTGAAVSKLIIAEISTSSFSTVTTVNLINIQGATAIDSSIDSVDLENDISSNSNYIEVSTQGVYSYRSPFIIQDINFPTKIAKLELNAKTGNNCLLIQPNANTSLGSAKLMGVYKAAIDGGSRLFEFNHNGNMYFGDSAGTYYKFNGVTWEASGSGGNFTINTGTGGSYLRTRCYGIQYQYYADGSTKAECRFSDGYWDFQQPVSPMTYTVATLAAGSPGAFKPGTTAFATDGRKSGEGAGSGTGCPVWWDGTNWLTFYDNTTVAA